MLVLLLFAFISGLVTILAPCIWPLLPIILSSTASGGHKKPLGITVGIMASFAVFTLAISYIVKIIPFDPNVLRLFAVIVIGFLGLTLIIPALSQLLEGWVSRLSGRFAPTSTNPSSGFVSGLVTGFSLGLVWSPCAGPILASIATLAATRAVNLEIILVTFAYVLGTGIPLFIFATVGRKLLTGTSRLSPYTGLIQRIFGVLMILTAIAIYTGYDKVIQTNLLNLFPAYTQGLTNLENQPGVQKEIKSLTGNSSQPNYGPAPDFVGGTKWLNTPSPLTIQSLRGKVVLVDFWTYTCINCIRTLPFVTSWYDKYHTQGFVVIGVHTPEFEFEKNTDNVLAAIKQYNIHYPVVQDNNYAIWQSYSNQYWPAEYLIDAKGNIRHTHFGEGEYDQTEKAIQDLLKEAGAASVSAGLVNMPDQTPTQQLTPETYLGSSKTEDNGETLNNNWDIQPEYAQAKAGASLDFDFTAAKVFLVMTPATTADAVAVTLDGNPINEIMINESKLYTLVDLQTVGKHKLHLDFKTPGTKVYAFTFGS